MAFGGRGIQRFRQKFTKLWYLVFDLVARLCLFSNGSVRSLDLIEYLLNTVGMDIGFGRTEANQGGLRWDEAP
jgi:hypothetical protein